MGSQVSQPPITPVPAATALPPSATSAPQPEPGRLLRLRPTQVLATVSGVALTPRDLGLRIGDHAQDLEIAEDRYRALLDSAIERELTVQAARKRGVELSAAQQRRVDELRAKAQASRDGKKTRWSDPDLSGPVAMEAQLSELAALMLQANLAERSGLPSPYVTPEDVARHYAENATAYPPLPSEPAARAVAWQQLEARIRGELASDFRSRYQTALRIFLERLRGEGDVRVNPA
jgi:hypothetical protein